MRLHSFPTRRSSDLEPLPDRELVDVPESLPPQERAEPPRDDERRLASEPLQGAEIEMVVVGVREEHRVDAPGGLGVDRHAPSQVGCKHAQHRIGEQAHPVERDQDGGVADPPDARASGAGCVVHGPIVGARTILR